MKAIFTLVMVVAFAFGWWLIPVKLYAETGSVIMMAVGFIVVVMIMAGMIQGLKRW